MMKKEQNSKPVFGIFSFFTGASFLDLGFEDAGFKTILANEVNHLEAKQKGVVLTTMKEGV